MHTQIELFKSFGKCCGSEFYTWHIPRAGYVFMYVYMWLLCLTAHWIDSSLPEAALQAEKFHGTDTQCSIM